jgi:hypothetical protein
MHGKDGWKPIGEILAAFHEELDVTVTQGVCRRCYFGELSRLAVLRAKRGAAFGFRAGRTFRESAGGAFFPGVLE